jgi:hypothetical protein
MGRRGAIGFALTLGALVGREAAVSVSASLPDLLGSQNANPDCPLHAVTDDSPRRI